MGGEDETGGREGLGLVSLVFLTEVEGVGLLPGRNELSGCAGGNALRGRALERLVEFQVGVAAPCRLGELSLFILGPLPPAFLFWRGR